MEIDVSATIVTYKNNPVELLKAINSFLKTTLKVRLYIIDNSPNKNLQSFVEINANIEYVFMNSNRGYGAGHNVIMRDTSKMGKYHLVLNPDVYFEEGVLERMIEYMEQHEDVGQMLPQVLYPDGRIQHLCKLIPTPLDLLFKRFLPKSWTQKRLSKFKLKFTGYNRIMNVPYLSGCFMLFRTSALQKVGIFDERYFMYPEDIDLTRRMHQKYKTLFFPEVSIVHAHAAASYKSKKMLWVHMMNIVKYFNKWGWFFDSERKRVNKQVLTELNFYRK